MAYDPDNIFAKILKGEIPCHKLYEDENTLAFLDIMPRSEGHALVVTKEKASDLFDISPEALAKLVAVVQALAPQIKQAVDADGVLIQQFNGSAVPLKRHAGVMADQSELAATAEKIRKKLAAR
jgi:histidine triad (HIT) family protein